MSLSPLLNTLYETIDDQTAWTPFLTALCEATGTDNAALIIHDLATAATLTVTCYFDGQEIRRYHETFAALNPWMPSPDKQVGSGNVVRTESELPLEALRETRFYKEWGQQNNVVHGIALNLGISEGRFTYLGLNNGEESGPIPDSVVALLNEMAPHIARAVRLQYQRLLAHSFRQGLDQTAGPVFFLRENGAVVDMTPSAAGMQEHRDPLWVHPSGLLRTTNRAAQKSLDKALKCAEQHRYQLVRLGDGWLGILTTLQEHAIGSAAGNRLRMLTLLNVQASAQGLEMFAPMFALTSAETRLVRAIIENGTLSSAAKQLGISRETAKTQVASVFRRTGARRQSDVIRLFSSLGVITRMGDSSSDTALAAASQ